MMATAGYIYGLLCTAWKCHPGLSYSHVVGTTSTVFTLQKQLVGYQSLLGFICLAQPPQQDAQGTMQTFGNIETPLYS